MKTNKDFDPKYLVALQESRDHHRVGVECTEEDYTEFLCSISGCALCGYQGVTDTVDKPKCSGCVLDDRPKSNFCSVEVQAAGHAVHDRDFFNFHRHQVALYNRIDAEYERVACVQEVGGKIAMVGSKAWWNGIGMAGDNRIDSPQIVDIYSYDVEDNTYLVRLKRNSGEYWTKAENIEKAVLAVGDRVWWDGNYWDGVTRGKLPPQEVVVGTVSLGRSEYNHAEYSIKGVISRGVWVPRFTLSTRLPGAGSDTNTDTNTDSGADSDTTKARAKTAPKFVVGEVVHWDGRYWVGSGRAPYLAPAENVQVMEVDPTRTAFNNAIYRVSGLGVWVPECTLTAPAPNLLQPLSSAKTAETTTKTTETTTKTPTPTTKTSSLTPTTTVTHWDGAGRKSSYSFQGKPDIGEVIARLNMGGMSGAWAATVECSWAFEMTDNAGNTDTTAFVSLWNERIDLVGGRFNMGRIWAYMSSDGDAQSSCGSRVLVSGIARYWTRTVGGVKTRAYYDDDGGITVCIPGDYGGFDGDVEHDLVSVMVGLLEGAGVPIMPYSMSQGEFENPEE